MRSHLIAWLPIACAAVLAVACLAWRDRFADYRRARPSEPSGSAAGSAEREGPAAEPLGSDPS